MIKAENNISKYLNKKVWYLVPKRCQQIDLHFTSNFIILLQWLFETKQVDILFLSVIYYLTFWFVESFRPSSNTLLVIYL